MDEFYGKDFFEEPKGKLKPCPFCGGEAEIKIGRSCMNKNYAVVCKDKTCQGRAHKTYFAEHTAIKSWNRRVNNG